ncbi:gluconokinase [Serratia microhaemolytica]|uniref:gluconokinase n=1 Tax=Serratia microhaemolytica TaxID=2675110 RepID=UPI000FDEA9DD|nr:gluconokinase [Serratia microhaemolytica]
MAGKCIIVMGVCGSGKSSIGLSVAQKLGAKFIDGDDLHPKANIQKMAAGNPLNDQDRAPWLERIRDAAYSLEQKNEVGVIVCSALKRQYRDQIREGNQSVCFLFMDGDQPLILKRMRARKGHFMRENMVQSQFDTLERPDGEAGVFRVDIDGSFNQVVDRALAALEQAP